MLTNLELWSWLCSGSAVAWLWMYGRKSIWGPRIGVFAQVFWVMFVLTSGQHGLWLAVVLFTINHAWNWHRCQQLTQKSARVSP